MLAAPAAAAAAPKPNTVFDINYNALPKLSKSGRQRPCIPDIEDVIGNDEKLESHRITLMQTRDRLIGITPDSAEHNTQMFTCIWDRFLSAEMNSRASRAANAAKKKQRTGDATDLANLLLTTESTQFPEYLSTLGADVQSIKDQLAAAAAAARPGGTLATILQKLVTSRSQAPSMAQVQLRVVEAKLRLAEAREKAKKEGRWVDAWELQKAMHRQAGAALRRRLLATRQEDGPGVCYGYVAGSLRLCSAT